MEKNQLLKRSEVPKDMTWDLSVLFSSSDDMSLAADKIFEKVEKLCIYKGKLMDNANDFYKFILLYEEILGEWSRVSTYGFVKVSVDATCNQNMKDSAKVRAWESRLNKELSFITNEICEADEVKIESFYKEVPELLNYKLAIDEIYKHKNHLLDAKTEEVLAAFSSVLDAPGYIYDISSSADMIFEDFEDANGNMIQNSFTLYEETYQGSEDTTIRRNSFNSFYNGLKKYNNTYAELYATEINRQVVEAKLRGFDSTIDMILFNQGIERKVYDNHLKVLFDNLSPVMQKYAKILKKQLKVDTLKYSDLKANLDTEFSPKAEFSQVKKMVLDALQIYDDEYLANINRMFDENRIDYSQNIGKSSGAYCTSPYGAGSLVKMSFSGTVRSAFTLVHELGHAGHFEMANKYQSILNSDCSMYFVEAPSTMNELILSKGLMEKADSPEFERWVILQNLDSYYHNCVTHFLEARFQDRVYKHADNGGQINADFLNAEKLAVIKEFWGDVVEVEKEAGMTWMRQSHYYAGLYPYTYSASLSISTHYFQTIEKEGKEAVDKWIEVLKKGGSLKTAELARLAGVDISKPDIFVSLAKHVETLVERLGELYE